MITLNNFMFGEKKKKFTLGNLANKVNRGFDKAVDGIKANSPSVSSIGHATGKVSSKIFEAGRGIQGAIKGAKKGYKLAEQSGDNKVQGTKLGAKVGLNAGKIAGKVEGYAKGYEAGNKLSNKLKNKI